MMPSYLSVSDPDPDRGHKGYKSQTSKFLGLIYTNFNFGSHSIFYFLLYFYQFFNFSSFCINIHITLIGDK